MKSQGVTPSLTEPPPTAQGTLDKVPTAFSSAWAPSAGRRQWVGVYRCPRCNGSHVTRAATLNGLGGIRRARCGRRVWVVVARRYGGTS